MAINFMKSNKIPLTDRKGKTIYVKPEDKDKYVLTNRGWLLKDKVYTYLSNRLDPQKGLVRCLDKRTGWQIHLDELKLKDIRQKDYEEIYKPWLKEHDPEWLANFEKEKAEIEKQTLVR